jgi:hypothetical protein
MGWVRPGQAIVTGIILALFASVFSIAVIWLIATTPEDPLS